MSTNRTPRDLLVSVQRSEFDLAAKLDKRQLCAQLASGLLAVFSLWLPNGIWGNVMAIVLLVLAGVTMWLVMEMRKHRSVGEKARRATLLVDGLGIAISGGELRRFATLTKATEEELHQWEEPAYFSSQEKPGVLRAVNMLQESAFWSENLYLASGRRAAALVIWTGVIAIICFLLALSVLGATQASLQVRVFSTVASSLVWFELLARMLHYSAAAQHAKEVLLRLEKGIAGPNASDEWLLALVDYNSVVETAPMMFPGVYAANRDRLNRLWDQYKG